MAPKKSGDASAISNTFTPLKTHETIQLTRPANTNTNANTDAAQPQPVLK
jgi:hypothetical protein